jgi:hypothetical protein
MVNQGGIGPSVFKGVSQYSEARNVQGALGQGPLCVDAGRQFHHAAVVPRPGVRRKRYGAEGKRANNVAKKVSLNSTA